MGFLYKVLSNIMLKHIIKIDYLNPLEKNGLIIYNNTKIRELNEKEEIVQIARESNISYKEALVLFKKAKHDMIQSNNYFPEFNQDGFQINCEYKTIEPKQNINWITLEFLGQTIKFRNKDIFKTKEYIKINKFYNKFIKSKKNIKYKIFLKFKLNTQIEFFQEKIDRIINQLSKTGIIQTFNAFDAIVNMGTLFLFGSKTKQIKWKHYKNKQTDYYLHIGTPQQITYTLMELIKNCFEKKFLEIFLSKENKLTKINLNEVLYTDLAINFLNRGIINTNNGMKVMAKTQNKKVKYIDPLKENTVVSLAPMALTYLDRSENKFYQIATKEHSLYELSKYWGYTKEFSDNNILDESIFPLEFTDLTLRSYAQVVELNTINQGIFTGQQKYVMSSDTFRINTAYNESLKNIGSNTKKLEHAKHLTLHLETTFKDHMNINHRLLLMLNLLSEELIENKETDYQITKLFVDLEKVIPFG